MIKINQLLLSLSIIILSSSVFAQFTHPGIYNSQEELEVIKVNINSTAPHPMKEGWKEMLSSTSHKITDRVKYTSLVWQPHPMEIVYPKEVGKQRFFNDGQAAYAHALQWVVTGKQVYANKAIELSFS